MEDVLTKRLKDHDEAAFEELMDRYLPLVSTIVYNIGRDRLSREDMEETVSDIFVTLWQNTDKIIPGKLQGYLCIIARTRALNRLSQVSRPPSLNIEELPLEYDFCVENIVEREDTAQLLQELIAGMREPDREIILRYYYYRQTAPRIAEILHMKLPTVKSKLLRGKEKMRKMLTERGYR